MQKKYQSDFNTRQTMIKNDFEIYYYEDTSFSGVKNHSHNYFEFYFFLEGDISMVIQNKQYHLHEGDLIIIPPNTKHHLIDNNPTIPYRRFVLWMSTSYLDSIKEKGEELYYIVKETLKNKQYIYAHDTIQFNAIQNKLFRLLEETYSNRFGQQIKISLCIYDLLHLLSRLTYENKHHNTMNTNQDILNEIIAYIETHLDENLSLDSIAEKFYCSKFHIAHTFKQRFGLSIHQFITKTRLEMCKHSLISGLNISEIYHNYGFKDYSNFYRAFKKEFGISPKEYKEIHTKSLQSK